MPIVDNRERRTKERAWAKICAALAASIESIGVDETSKALRQASRFVKISRPSEETVAALKKTHFRFR